MDMKKPPVEVVKLTPYQYKDLVVRIEEMGRNRKREQGRIDEADFLCGAMAVFFLLDIPVPSWPLAMITGRDILSDGPKKRGKNS